MGNTLLRFKQKTKKEIKIIKLFMFRLKIINKDKDRLKLIRKPAIRKRTMRKQKET